MVTMQKQMMILVEIQKKKMSMMFHLTQQKRVQPAPVKEELGGNQSG